MKKYIPYLVIFLVGAVIGMWLCRQYHFRDATKMFQRDTVVRYDTIRYSRLELAGNTYELELPRTGSTEFVFVQEDSVSYIYRDSIRYVTLPRQYFYTKTMEAEIWHSGIQSTIDSLNVFQRTVTVTEKTREKAKRNSVSIGAEVNYTKSLGIPVQVQYAYRIAPWLSVYGYGEYEFLSRQIGVGIGTELTIEY